jgi:predicted transcriptional regulator
MKSDKEQSASNKTKDIILKAIPVKTGVSMNDLITEVNMTEKTIRKYIKELIYEDKVSEGSSATEEGDTLKIGKPSKLYYRIEREVL